MRSNEKPIELSRTGRSHLGLDVFSWATLAVDRHRK